MEIVYLILVGIVAYLIGSIPWALVIGKVFYGIDVREHGSKNLGGSNAGRVLGKVAGVTVIILDGLKAFIITALCAYFLSDIPLASVIAGLFACIGHCFPLFANFKGGKAVATTMGYILAISIFVAHDFVFIFLCPFLIFMVFLAISKWVSLSSIIMIASAAVISYITLEEKMIAYSIIAIWIFVTYRHKDNIIRIIKNTEKKITWIK